MDTQISSERVMNKNVLGTYDVLIAQNILNQLNLNLETTAIVEGLEDEQSPYFALLKLPMLNSLNAMILSQIETYKLFCQTRLADYIILTNPTEAEQESSEFEDKLSEDLHHLKNMLMAFQAQLRETSQQHYDQLADCLRYLKLYVNKSITRLGNFDWQYDDEFMERSLDFQQQIEAIKLRLLEQREQAADIAKEISCKLLEKQPALLDRAEDLQQRLELNFYKFLGLDVV